jgi:mevalonate kinase
MTILISKSPAKLILSGEHSVVYGMPAIAVAINDYISLKLTSVSNPKILFHSVNFNYSELLTLSDLKLLKLNIDKKYKLFKLDKLPIENVINNPLDLLEYSFIHFLETYGISINHGFEIEISSKIAIGCSMGSSSALITSILQALQFFFKININKTEFFTLAREIENLQHGYSSGIDIYLAIYGGCVKFDKGASCNNNIEKNIKNIDMHIIQTGKPMTTTGQAVAHVTKIFKNSNIAEKFRNVTQMFEKSLKNHDLDMMHESIKYNHRLLIEIGVVPNKIQSFIKNLEKNNGSAKICGSGAINGDNAGAILLLGNIDISSLCKEYNYKKLEISHRGMHIL